MFAVHVRVLDFFVFVLPLGFLVFTVMVRVVPYFVPPTLEIRYSDTITTLRLTD